jgi:hypothetical protein
MKRPTLSHIATLRVFSLKRHRQYAKLQRYAEHVDCEGRSKIHVGTSAFQALSPADYGERFDVFHAFPFSDEIFALAEGTL